MFVLKNKLVGGVYKFFFKPRFSHFQLNLVIITFFILGSIFGLYYLANSVLLPKIRASSSPWMESNWSTESDYSSITDIDNSTEGEFKLDVKEGWFNDDWLYRELIIITNPNEELEDFQVMLDLDTASLIASDKMQVDCQDIRFADNLGNGLNYWIESGCNTDSSKVWVKLNSIPNGESEIYLYYGNSGASSDSNGSETFIIYEDFSSMPDNWSAESSPSTNWESIDGVLRSTTLSADYSSFTSDSPILEDFVIEVDWKHSGVTHGGLNFRGQETAADYGYQWIIRPTSNPAINRIQKRTPAQSYPISERSAGTNITANTWYKISLKLVGQQLDAYIGESLAISGEMNDTTYSSGKVGFQHYDGTNYFDNFRVRKAVINEPTTNLSAVEETKYAATGVLASNIFDSGHPSDWGILEYNKSGSGTITLRVRSDSQADMSSADNFTDSCNLTFNCTEGTCTSTDTISNLSACVEDEERYLQYQVILIPEAGSTPVFENISIAFNASDQEPPHNQASEIRMYAQLGGSEITDADTDENSWTNSSTPFFSWTAGEDGVDGTDIYYCLYLGTDDTADPRSSKGLLGVSEVNPQYTDCNGGFIIDTNSIDFSNSSYRGSTWLNSSGDYYLIVTAIDKSGNAKASPFTSFHFQYDGVAPTNPSGLSAPQSYQSQIDSITVYWPSSGTSAAADDVGGSQIAGYQYKIGSSGTWYGNNHTGSQDISDLITDSHYALNSDYDNLDEGENTFYLRTWDNAGNVSNTTVTAILKYSGNAPTEPQNLTVDPESSDDNSFAFTWDSPALYDGQESGLEYCYSVNTVPSAISCTWTNNSFLTADAYATQPSTNTFYVVAKDEAGNVNYQSYSNINFDCDTSAPGIPQSVDIADVSVKATKAWRLTISWEEPEDLGAGVKNYQIYHSTDDESYSQVSATSGISYVDSNLTQQTHYYKVRACDSANNCGAFSEAVSLYPDGKFTESASLTSNPSVSNVTTKKATISWTTDRSSDSRVQYGIKSNEYYEEEVSNSNQVTEHEINLSSLDAETTYYYRAKWTDEDGNTGISEEKTFTTDPAPSLSSVQATDIGLETAYIAFTISNAIKVTIQYGETTSYGGSLSTTVSRDESNQSFRLTGLADGTKYHYRFVMEDSEGEEYYSDDYSDLETLPRPQISNVRLQEVTGTAQPALLVTWESNTEISSIVTYYPQGQPAQAQDNVNVNLIKGEHKMLLKGLLPETNYVLTAKGRDKVGNEASSSLQNFTTATDTRPPLMNNLKVNGSIKGAGEEAQAQLVVTWNTDEPATSQVEFGEGSGSTYSQRTQQDTNLTYNHLDPTSHHKRCII